MAIHWQVKFRSLRANTLYTVNIYDDSYTGSPVQLTGAAEPFVTQEDDSKDFFTPVRIQSGYLRIVDDGYIPDGDDPFDWQDLLPESVTSRPVVLRNAEGTSEVLWAGFIQQQQADNTLFEYPIERDYAVYDVLGASYHIDFNTGITGPTAAYVNFAFLIKRFADLLPADVRPANYYIQDYDHAAQRLLCQVNPQLFHDVDVETRQNLADTPCHYTCGEVLEEIAKFWGFTIRSHGNALYFTQDFSDVGNGHSDFLKLTYSQLSTMAGGTSAGSRYYAPSAEGIGGSETGSTENYLAPAERYDETLVTADIGEHTAIVTIFDEMLKTCLPAATFGSKGANLIVASTQADGYVFDGVLFNRPTFSIWQGNLYGLLNEDDPFNFATQMHYDYMAGDGLPADYVASLTNYIKLEQLWPYCYNGCKMSMEATFFNTDGSLLNAPEENTDVWGPVGTKMLHMSIAFVSSSGTVYFNGSRWKDTDEGCYCRIGGSNNYIYPLSGSPRLPNLNPAMLRNRMPSRYIVMPDGTGRLIIKIYGAYSDVSAPLSPNDVRPMSLGIGNFTAKVDRIVRDQLDASDSNEYYNGTRGKADRDVASVWSVDTIFASDNLNQFGLGTVLDGNGSPLTTLTIHNHEYRPEEWVSELAYTYYTKKRMVIDLDLRDDINHVVRISPARRFTFKGMLFHPVSISRQWNDSTVRIIGMQVNTEGYRTYSVTPLAGTGIASVSGGGTVYEGDPAQVSCYPSDGYAFRYWQDAHGNVLSYNQTYRIPQVTGNMTLTAVGVEDTRTFVVRVLTATGVQSVSGGGEYRVGTLVTIGCVLGSDYTFTGWQQDGPYGELVSLQQTFQLRVRQDITLYPMTSYAGTDAVFRIFFGVEQPDFGYIRDDDNDIVYHNGDEYEMLDTEVRNFTAVPSIGYEFDKWKLDGEVYATKNPIIVTGEELLADQTLTAVFRKKIVVTDWTLTLRAVLRYTRITVRVDDYTPQTFEFSNVSDVFTIQVPAGAQVQLTASYNGFEAVTFKWWADADAPAVHETSQTLSIDMDKNKDITCVYE